MRKAWIPTSAIFTVLEPRRCTSFVGKPCWDVAPLRALYRWTESVPQSPSVELKLPDPLLWLFMLIGALAEYEGPGRLHAEYLRLKLLQPVRVMVMIQVPFTSPVMK